MTDSASPSVNAHIEADDDENGETNIEIIGENDIGDAEGENNALQKKKKKKKPKKSATAKAKEAAEKAAKMKGSESKPPVLCISRNKHWRYISSYHVSAVACFTPYSEPTRTGPMATTSYRTTRVFTGT